MYDVVDVWADHDKTEDTSCSSSSKSCTQSHTNVRINDKVGNPSSRLEYNHHMTPCTTKANWNDITYSDTELNAAAAASYDDIVHFHYDQFIDNSTLSIGSALTTMEHKTSNLPATVTVPRRISEYSPNRCSPIITPLTLNDDDFVVESDLDEFDMEEEPKVVCNALVQNPILGVQSTQLGDRADQPTQSSLSPATQPITMPVSKIDSFPHNINEDVLSTYTSTAGDKTESGETRNQPNCPPINVRNSYPIGSSRCRRNLFTFNIRTEQQSATRHCYPLQFDH